MLKENHIACAQLVTTSIALVEHQTPLEAIPFLVGSYLGADLPDVDHPYNHLHQSLQRLHLCPDFKHRGITHTLWVVLILTGLTLWTAHISPIYISNFLFGLTLGYTIHLIIDDFSKQGIMWLYPLSKYHTTAHGYEYKKRKHYMPLYRTGGTFEFYVGLIVRLAWYYLSFKLYFMWLK